jgi:chemotaxis methyl-accepting protein methylase
MIFSIQRDLEDYFNHSGLSDPDQYSVALAKLYDRDRSTKNANAFLSAMRRMRTAFFRANNRLQRRAFERKVLARLDAKFKKKVCSSSHKTSPKELRCQVSTL